MAKRTYVRIPESERFESKVDKSAGPDGCWPWLARRSKKGYGEFEVWRNGKWIKGRAHAVAHEIYIGPIPAGMCVCHICDTPWCVNPKHFFVGTHVDNAKDRAEKGRSSSGPRHWTALKPDQIRRGTEHPNARLNAEQVREIRTRREDGESLAVLAKDFGTTMNTISRVARRIVYASIS
jgi:hypothetical protein